MPRYIFVHSLSSELPIPAIAAYWSVEVGKNILDVKKYFRLLGFFLWNPGPKKYLNVGGCLPYNGSYRRNEKSENTARIFRVFQTVMKNGFTLVWTRAGLQVS